MDDDGVQEISIGEFSRLTGLSEKALRLYDARHLLAPARVDPATGYRWYHTQQIDEGRMVALLRSIDMPLSAVGDVMALDPPKRAAAVAEHWYRVERRLDDRRGAVRAMRGRAAEEGDMGVIDQVMSAGREEGAFAAIGELAAVADIEAAADGYAEAMKAAYWDAKDLTVATAMAYAGCSRLLAAAAVDEDEERAYRLRSTAKALMYNLASFSWPGWGEPGIEIAGTDAAAGLAAARTNLVMAVDLDKGDLALSRGHWMLAAHLLTGGDLGGAESHFAEGRRFAETAGAPSEALLAAAFLALTRLAAGSGTEDDLAAAVADLAATDDGPSFVDQVVTARAVLGV